MNIRVYLKKEVKNHAQYMENGNSIVAKIEGLSVYDKETSNPYISIDPEDEVPEVVSGFVTVFSLHQTIPAQHHRELGEYQFNTASAVVDSGVNEDERPHASIRIKSKSLEDTKVLYSMIRSGSIRPKKSYEIKQVVEESENEIAKLKDKLALSTAVYIKMKGEFSRLAMDIEGESSIPIIKRRTVVRRMHRILDGKCS